MPPLLDMSWAASCISELTDQLASICGWSMGALMGNCRVGGREKLGTPPHSFQQLLLLLHGAGFMFTMVWFQQVSPAS